MRVLFVDNLLIDQNGQKAKYDLQPHLGLLSLMAVAESGGHEALLYDPKLELTRGTLALDANLYRDMAAALLDRAPDVIGFTTLGCNFICTLKVARHVRAARPDIPIILGGPHATILAREILERFPEFDAVARHEAELTLLPLLDGVVNRSLENLAGVTYRHSDAVIENPGTPTIADLDALPRPLYERYPIADLKPTSLRVEAGRGCPFHCTFCSTASFFGRKYRLRSAPVLVAELDHLHETYGISDFGLTHDLFTVSKVKVREFCAEVNGHGYRWSCSARMDCVDDELLAEMADAGCRAIYYGVETGSPRMQKIAQKHQDLDLFEPVIDTTLRLGMKAIASFITGYPQETEDDQKQTLDMIGRCFTRDEPKLLVQFHLLTPEPGTQLMTDFRDSLEYDGHISDFNFPTIEDDDAAVMQEHRDVFMNHHYFRSVLPRERHVFVTSAFQVLLALGFPFLTRVIARYGGTFGDLMTAMYDAAREDGWERQPTFARIAALFGEWWGDSDPIVTMTRYLFTAHTLGEGTPPPAGKYRLSPRAAVCTSIPNCPRILDVMRSQREPEENLWADTGNYLLVLDNAAERQVRNFEVDDQLADFCSFLTRPRSRRALVERARRFGGGAAWAGAALDHLAQLGAVDYAAPS